MQRSSETIGTIASALAKAQAELTNPEKSLVATICTDGPGRIERSFRYAPLSSGLEIVRKTLSQHEIATVQTTAVDHAAGIINLTTTLAHSSGEWIASDWPVCAITETATPHRMGAALTYARRYGLFTLVGIAGEDDIDAPDLNAAPTTSAPGADKPAAKNNSHSNGGSGPRPRPAQGGSSVGALPRPFPPMLDVNASAAMRDQLAAELKGIGSAEEAATWAHRVLGAKGSLTAADAEEIEIAFQAKLATFDSAAETNQQTLPPKKPAVTSFPKRRSRARRNDPKGADKSQLTHPETRRIRDRDHVRYVAKQACLVCGRTSSDPHHLRFAQRQALGRKVSDEFTVPLCRGHHRELHRCGDEARWWRDIGIDPAVAARALWLKSHPLPRMPKRISGEGVTAQTEPGFKDP